MTVFHCLCFCKVVLIGVPGAFTPTCSLKHLPGFLEKADELKSKGVDTIACVAVNDAFVMDAWSKSVGTDDKIMMLADGSADFTKVIDSADIEGSLIFIATDCQEWPVHVWVCMDAPSVPETQL